MQELIERLEKATGPDRELDLAIGQLLPPPHPFSLSIEQQRGGKPPVPAFTASIDAALTLVPEGWDWRVSGPDWHDGRRNMHFGHARQYRKAGDWRRDAEGNARHTRPAIALCIAILYALAMKSDNPA